MLYQADIRQVSLMDVLASESERAAGEPDRQASWSYARDIVDGVIEAQSEVDAQIEAAAKDWSLARMPAIDRALLRIAAWEILYAEDVDAAVAVNEAVELAKEYSTDDSARFINGVLGGILMTQPGGK